MIGSLSERSLSIIVPAYDEEERIVAFLDAVTTGADAVAAAAQLTLSEVLVVDDGSRDATPRLLLEYAAVEPRLRVITFPRNRGKGAAVRAGMLAARGTWALLTDVDLSTPLDDLCVLSRALGEGADLAIGSRALPRSEVLVRQPVYRETMGKGFNLLLRLLTGLTIRDSQCGFKLFRLETTRPLFELQRIEGFAFDAELCVLASQRGLTVAEVPVRWTNDPRTHVSLVGASSRMAIDLLRIAWLARGRRLSHRWLARRRRASPRGRPPSGSAGHPG
ncbi:MAG: glycosyltransferase family 2 protein [Actinobacteria bacterium]|nr:glycosyltransferase family 2 protein [Actinomycetota bacterium]